MTKKEAMGKIKSEYHHAVTATRLKDLKDLYAKVKALEVSDDDNISEEIANEING